MAFDGETYRITIAEAHSLPEREFRDLFVASIIELIGDMGTRALNIAFLNEGRRTRDLSTSEMRHVVLAHQDLLNPLAPKKIEQFEVLSLKRAHEMLKVGAERALKILFCEAVHAMNEWRGQWSPLPAVPERCSTQEILDLLAQHPHWFAQNSARADV